MPRTVQGRRSAIGKPFTPQMYQSHSSPTCGLGGGPTEVVPGSIARGAAIGNDFATGVRQRPSRLAEEAWDADAMVRPRLIAKSRRSGADMGSSGSLTKATN